MKLGDEIQKEIFEIISLDKKVNKEFKKNIITIHELLSNNKDSNMTLIETILNFTKSTNNNLNFIFEEEVNFLYKDLISDKTFKTDKSIRVEKISFPLEKYLNFDYFNKCALMGKNLFLLNEAFTNKSFNIQLDTINSINSLKNNSLFRIEKRIVNIEPNLLERSVLILGEEETSGMTLNFNRLNDLSYLKYDIELNKILQTLLSKIPSNKDLNIFYLIDNFNFLTRNGIIPKEKLFIKLQNAFPKEQKSKLIELNSLVDYLYTFRNKIQTLQSDYIQEINENLINSEKIFNESLSDYVNKLKVNITEWENVKLILFRLYQERN